MKPLDRVIVIDLSGDTRLAERVLQTVSIIA